MVCCRCRRRNIAIVVVPSTIHPKSCDAIITNIIVIGTGEKDDKLSKKSGKREQDRRCGIIIPEACCRKEAFGKIESMIDCCGCKITVNINMIVNVDNFRYRSKERMVLQNGTV